MVLPLIHAGIIVAAALVCLFFRYKDGSPFGSFTAGLLAFILSALLLGGLTVPGTTTAIGYENVVFTENTTSCVNGTWNNTLLYPEGWVAGHYLAGGVYADTATIIPFAGNTLTTTAWYKNFSSSSWVHYANASGAYYYNGVASPLGYHPITVSGGEVYAGVTGITNTTVPGDNVTLFNGYASNSGSSITKMRGVIMQAKEGLTVRSVSKYNNCTALAATLMNANRTVFLANATFVGTTATFNYHFNAGERFYILAGITTSYTSAWKANQPVAAVGTYANRTGIFNGDDDVLTGNDNIYNIANVTLQNDTGYYTAISGYFNGTLDNLGAWEVNYTQAGVVAESAASGGPANDTGQIYYAAFDNGALPYYYVGNCSGTPTTQYATRMEKLPTTQATAAETVDGFISHVLSVLCMGISLIFLMDGFKLYTTKKTG